MFVDFLMGLYILFEKFDKDDKILYLDLDVDVTDDIAYFFKLPNDKPYMPWNYWAEDKPEEWKWLYYSYEKKARASQRKLGLVLGNERKKL